MQKRTSIRSLLYLILVSTTLFAQSDRGTIVGTVADPSSAVVTGAKVEARNQDNGSVFNAVTTATGDFTISSVPGGKYNVTVTATGFKTASETGVQVLLDQTTKVNFALAIGQTSESISVTATPDVLKTDNAEQSMNVSGEKVSELPLNFSGGSGAIRSWLSFTFLAPGVNGTSATGSEVNGLPSGAFKIYLEGQDSTSSNGATWVSTVASASVEAITEFAVQSSNFSAEFGQVMGGLYNFTTKSGTNQYHGSAYENWANEVMDAAHPFNHLTDKDRKNDYGFSIGGPVRIPKVYNGKNHTFFFFNWERFANNIASTAQTGNLPTDAYRSGDFSSALHALSNNGTGAAVTLTDPTTGYTFLQNQIFDPDTTYTDTNGHLTRTPFTNNIIPMSRLDPVSLKVQALIPGATTQATNTNNWAPHINGNMQQAIPSLKIDQDFGPKTKVSFFWTYQSTNHLSSTDGLPEPISGVRTALVQGNQYRLNVDRTITPNLLAHIGVGFYYFKNPDSSPAASLNYDVLSNLGLVGTATGTGFPQFLGSTTVGNEGGLSNGLGPNTADHQVTQLGSTTGSLSWVKGKSTYKAGYEFKSEKYSDANYQGAEGIYNWSANQTAVPFLNSTSVGNTGGTIGAGYASFLLGDTNEAKVNPPKATQLRRVTEGLYVQDQFKATSKLTLEIGVRWDRVPLGTELHDRQEEIGLNVPNPNAGNVPGGFIFAGSGAGRCNCQFSKTYNFGIGPRLSAAYQIDKKTVIRAGWGLSYSGGDDWAYLNGGYNLTGLGYNTVDIAAPGFGIPATQFKNGIVYNQSQLRALNLSPGANTTVGQINAFSGVWGGLYNDPSAGRPARINQWNIALQRQLSKDTSIEAAYVGNRGVWEPSNGLVNLNAIRPQVLAAHNIDLTTTAGRNLMGATVCSPAAVNAGITLPYSTFPCGQTVQQSLRPFPEYSTLAAEFVDQGNSWYDSLQVKFNKRFSHGLDLTSNYTFSKTETLGGGALDGNIYNRNVQKQLDPGDYPNIWVTAFTYSTPKFSSNHFVRAATGNWTLGGTLRYGSGGLIQAPASQNGAKWSNYTYMSNVPQIRVSGQPLYLTNINCGCINPNNINQRILNPAAWQDIPAGSLIGGSYYYNDYRGPHQASENINFGRRFQLREKMTLEVRAEFYNILNRVYLNTPSSGNPTQTVSTNATGAITGFGYYSIGTTSNLGGQRSGDLVARFQF